jgi:crotonobetainyl-CoA:carnitine CoA-transferase CaiB-like acyl-CoA transferase
VDELPLAEHPVTGPYRVIPPMATFSATPAAVRRPAPLIGEHTAEIIAEIDAEIDAETTAGIDAGTTAGPPGHRPPAGGTRP